MVERLLQSELSVDEWSKRNGVSKATMYNWLSTLATTEPDLFGGKQNIADTEKRNWLQITRKNIADSHALALREPTGVLIVDTDEGSVHTPGASKNCLPPQSSIQVAINGAHVAIPQGAPKADIAHVLQVVASL